MTWCYGRMAGLAAAVGVLTLMAGLASAPREARATTIAFANLCDNTCNPGSPLTNPPCQTSGSCTPSANAPPGTTCVGCNFQILYDLQGNVIGCQSSCSGSAPPPPEA